MEFLNFKSKHGAFCALLSIGFKVCRLTIETVTDHIRKTVTNRLYFPLLFQSLRDKNQELRSIVIAGTQKVFRTLHYRTAQGIAVDTLKWKDKFKSV